MSAATFTPGPWSYQPSAGDHDYLVYDEATGRDVVIVLGFNPHYARLVAAAPELLEALREVFRNCEPFQKADNMAGRLSRIARDAIAKAEGSAD